MMLQCVSRQPDSTSGNAPTQLPAYLGMPAAATDLDLSSAQHEGRATTCQ